MKNLVHDHIKMVKELIACGATPEAANALAAALVVRNSDASSLPSGISRLQDIKSSEGAVTYAHRGEVLRVHQLKVRPNSSGQDQVYLRISCRRGLSDVGVNFKSDQAFRVLALITLKFVEFSNDAHGGFDEHAVFEEQNRIAKEFSRLSKSVSPPAQYPVELNRNIRAKAEADLGLSVFLVPTLENIESKSGPEGLFLIANL